MNTGKQRWLGIRGFTLVGGFCCICYFATLALLPVAGRWLNVGGPLATSVRFCYVLGGGADTRPVIAAELWRTGVVDQILVPNPPGFHNERCNPISEKDLIIAVLRQEQVPESAIVVLDGQPVSTEEEIDTLVHFLLTHQMQGDVAVVTHNYHTRRARRCAQEKFQSSGLNKVCELYFVSVPTDEFGPDDWWKYQSGLEAYLLEFAKTFRDVVLR